MKRTKRAALIALLMALGAPTALPATAADGGVRRDQLPNLVPHAVSDISIGTIDEGPAPAIRFDASIENSGDYAFELVGRPEGYLGGNDTSAEQCVAWAGPRACSARRSVGTLTYHAAHGHYHFDDFALYELRRFKKNGQPNMRPKGLVVKSDKVSFCLQDVQRGEGAGAAYAAPWPLYYACLAGMGVQGISPGWIDIYGPRLTGQQIPLAGVPDGTYALVIHTDPGRRVFETDDTDNVSVTGIELSDTGKKVEIVCRSAPGSITCR